MFCVHCAVSLLFAAPASAAAPLCTGDPTVLPLLQVQPESPDSKPGLVTRLAAAEASWVVATKPAAARPRTVSTLRPRRLIERCIGRVSSAGRVSIRRASYFRYTDVNPFARLG